MRQQQAQVDLDSGLSGGSLLRGGGVKGPAFYGGRHTRPHSWGCKPVSVSILTIGGVLWAIDPCQPCQNRRLGRNHLGRASKKGGQMGRLTARLRRQKEVKDGRFLPGYAAGSFPDMWLFSFFCCAVNQETRVVIG